ncbi:MAG: hypothetical protein RLZ98_1630 [Pseudomonadota bacterium]|jgi:hypothetical protein
MKQVPPKARCDTQHTPLKLKLLAMIAGFFAIVSASTNASAHGCHAYLENGPGLQNGPSGWHRHDPATCRIIYSRRARAHGAPRCRQKCEYFGPFKHCTQVCTRKLQSARRRYVNRKHARTTSIPKPPPAVDKHDASNQQQTAAPTPIAEILAPAQTPDCAFKGARANRVEELEYERNCYAAYEKLSRYRLSEAQLQLRKLQQAGQMSSGRNRASEPPLDSTHFVGRTLSLDTSMGPVAMTFHRDGKVDVRTNPAIEKLIGAATVEGKWRVAENRLCQQWSKLLGEPELCFDVVLKGDVVHWKSENGQSGTARLIPTTSGAN